jgi:hypothetical protein
MGSIKYDFRANDTLPVIRISIFDEQTKQIIPLFGTHTANIVWSIDGAASVSRATTVLDTPNNGKVEYQFLTGELVAGTMIAQVQVTEIASGKIATTINDIKKLIGPVL